MIRSGTLPRADLSAHGTQLVLAAIAVGGMVASIAIALGTGDLALAGILLGVFFAPVLLFAALRWPYVFPYGFYVMLVPFDNLLKIGGSGTLTKMFGIAAIVAIAAHALLVRRVVPAPKTLALWAAFVLWYGIAVMWSPDVPTALLFMQTLISIGLLYAVLSVAPIDERQLRTICGFIIAGGVAASLYGIYLLHNAPQMTGDYGRLMISVGERKLDPNHFANALLAPIALALVGLVSARRPAWVLGYLGALAVLAAGVVISLSRETLLGCVIIVFVVIMMSRRRLLGLAIGVPMLTLVPFLVPSIGQRMSDALSSGGAGRTALWHAAWLGFLQKPLFGWGTSGAIDAYDANFFQVYQRHSVGWIITPHNTPLHVAVELGIIGLVLFALAYVATFRQLRLVPREDRLWDLRVGLTAALAALVFVGFLIDLATYKYVWLVLAAIAQLRSVALSRPTQTVYVGPVEIEQPALAVRRRATAR